MLIDPPLTLWLTERDEQDVGSGRTDAGLECFLLLGGQLTKGGTLGADNLKPGVTAGKPSSRFLGDSFGPPKEKQAISLPGRLGAQYEDQV